MQGTCSQNHHFQEAANARVQGHGSWKKKDFRVSGGASVARQLPSHAQEDLFCGQRLALRLLAGALWGYTSNLHLSSDQTSVLLGVDARVLRALFERFNQLLKPLIDQLNDSLWLLEAAEWTWSWMRLPFGP